MASGILSESYTFNTNMLIEPIRKKTHIRQLMQFDEVLQTFDKRVEIETLQENLPVTVDMEVYESATQSHELVENAYSVPAVTTKLSYTYDELLRLENSSLPMNKRVEIAGYSMANTEDALAFAVSSTGVKDGDNMPLLENGTSLAWDIDAYSTGVTSMGGAIGAFVTEFGDIKQFPLILGLNAKAFTTSNGIINTNSDKSLHQYWDEQLKLHGAPGSGIMTIPNLGAALTVGDDNETVITAEADEAVALFCVDKDHFNIYSSPIQSRQDPVSEINGLMVQPVERMITRVFNAKAIQYDIDATP